jgi:hypothetical protein
MVRLIMMKQVYRLIMFQVSAMADNMNNYADVDNVR